MAEKITLVEIAEQLKGFADLLADGQVEVGGVNLAVGQPLKWKMKQKLSGGQVKLDISLVAALPGAHCDCPPPAKGARQKDGKGAGKKGGGHHRHRGKSRPHGAKAQKKKVSALWKQVMADVAAGRLPAPAVSEELLATAALYGAEAPESWARLWQQCVAEIEDLLAAAGRGDFARARQGVARVKDLKSDCHRAYK
ncbi:MAG: hypothetical protein ABFR97_00170 [Thermodesulfobacteriota bacterium]